MAKHHFLSVSLKNKIEYSILFFYQCRGHVIKTSGNCVTGHEGA